MPTCKDCIHGKVCTGRALGGFWNAEKECRNFKDRSKFIELPYALKCGDPVYHVVEAEKGEASINGQIICDPMPITEIGSKGFWISASIVDKTQIDDYIPYEEIGKTVFLSHEAAAKALKERQE